MEYEDYVNEQNNAEGWIMSKCEQWRDHYESNYREKFDEYYRLWRGIWAPEDTLRHSERSRLISPALQQAVESSVAEVEEATFGRGSFFDIKDDLQDQERGDISVLKKQLAEDFAKTKVRKQVAEAILNAAVFGTGVAELVLDEQLEAAPATRPVMDGAMTAVGVEKRERFIVKVKPVLPQNFLIDPVATTVEDALGVAIDEFVPKHQVDMMINKGIYRDVQIDSTFDDLDLEPDQELTIYQDDKVRLTKYYGLIPRDLYEDAIKQDYDDDVDVSDLVEKEESDVENATDYVEVVAVIANGGTLLKIEENPYMMQDRPIVAFPWDVVPGRFWGRGICEKGYNSQKALDTELRARIDALALTVHPMLAVDASRLPRGSKFEVRPGKAILTNGNPAEILQPFKFGQLDQVSFAQAKDLMTMVQQATGAIDAAGIPGSINSESTAAGISMGLGAIIKRHKRTLINFQESFLIPMIEKSAWRYMQFAPEIYPVSDYKFVPTSSLGIIAREYEVTQLVQLLQTMDKQSPMYPQLLEAIIDHMNISNREELIQSLRKSAQPDPQAQQAQQAQAQAQQAQIQAQVNAFNAQAAESQARAQKIMAEIPIEQFDAETDRIKALSTNLKAGDADDKEFEKRAKIAELYLKEQALNQQASRGVTNADENRMEQPVGTNQPEVRPTGGEDQQARARAFQALQNAQAGNQ
jgi:hypothetical protein